MSAKDPIIEEVRQVKEEIARKYGYDLRAMVRAIQDEQKKNPGEYVKRKPERIKPAVTSH